MKSICKTSAEGRESSVCVRAALLLLALCLAACATHEPPLPRKLALLAPFEGQYREIGYNALYSLRLAFDDAKPQTIQLLAVDDGGSAETAVDRVKALKLDPAVAAIIALGPAATHPSAQMANDLPMILIGNWGYDREDEDSLYAANPKLAQADGSGDLKMLFQARDLAADSATITFVSSGAPADAGFRQRYQKSGLYTPPPNLLATLTYDIARLALAALSADITIRETEYQGLNGLIRFEDGYWADAPMRKYRYQDGELALAAD